MLTKEQLTEAQDYICGTCMISTEQALSGILERSVTQEELDKFNSFLEDAGVFECKSCGWTSYPGEGNGITCDDCLAYENADEEN